MKRILLIALIILASCTTEDEDICLECYEVQKSELIRTWTLTTSNENGPVTIYLKDVRYEVYDPCIFGYRIFDVTVRETEPDRTGSVCDREFFEN